MAFQRILGALDHSEWLMDGLLGHQLQETGFSSSKQTPKAKVQLENE
jgi:hypothetical protein